MDDTKPKDIADYKKWLKCNHGVEITDKNKNYYNSVVHRIWINFQNSDFWTSVVNQLNPINQEYFLKTKYYLFTLDKPPELQVKTFESFLMKTFRKNIVDNPNWPSEPSDGWILPENWYARTNDLVRTCFIVKYLDGVNFFVNKINSLCEENGLSNSVDFEAKEEGYYAAHVYTTFPCAIPKEDWDTKQIDVKIELQVTTQLQEVIRKLLHQYYEDRRKKIEGAKVKWQWDYESDEFAANYLGHILHYVEGMIMDIRNKQEERE